MISPARWRAHLAAHVPVARAGMDPEGVHQVRVAAARLSVWIELSGRRVLGDDLRWLRRSLGRVRDLDVLLDDAHPPAWRAWLAAERDVARLDLVATLGAPRLAGLLAALDVLPELGRDPAARRLERFHKRVRRAGRRVERDPSRIEDLHRLRRALRRLRYALDWLDRDARALRALQEELGRMNNVAVALRALAASPLAGELDLRRRALEHDLEGRARRAWNAWKGSRRRIERL